MIQHDLPDATRELLHKEGELRVLRLENDQLQRLVNDLRGGGAGGDGGGGAGDAVDWRARADAEAKRSLEAANESTLLAFDLEQARARLAELEDDDGARGGQ